MRERSTATTEIADEDRELAAELVTYDLGASMDRVAETLAKIRLAFEAELERASDAAHASGYAEGLENGRLEILSCLECLPNDPCKRHGDR